MYPRFLERQIREAMTDTPVVLLCGPGQSGKTTLAQRIPDDTVSFVSLDDATTLDAALSDPVGFVRGLDKAIIDEVQRAPDFLLAIKADVDADQRAGRFLLTGSARVQLYFCKTSGGTANVEHTALQSTFRRAAEGVLFYP